MKTNKLAEICSLSNCFIRFQPPLWHGIYHITFSSFIQSFNMALLLHLYSFVCRSENFTWRNSNLDRILFADLCRLDLVIIIRAQCLWTRSYLGRLMAMSSSLVFCLPAFYSLPFIRQRIAKWFKAFPVTVSSE